MESIFYAVFVIIGGIIRVIWALIRLIWALIGPAEKPVPVENKAVKDFQANFRNELQKAYEQENAQKGGVVENPATDTEK